MVKGLIGLLQAVKYRCTQGFLPLPYQSELHVLVDVGKVLEPEPFHLVEERHHAREQHREVVRDAGRERLQDAERGTGGSGSGGSRDDGGRGGHRGEEGELEGRLQRGFDVSVFGEK